MVGVFVLRGHCRCSLSANTPILILHPIYPFNRLNNQLNLFFMSYDAKRDSTENEKTPDFCRNVDSFTEIKNCQTK